MEGDSMVPPEQQLLSDTDLREASFEQIWDLVVRINATLKDRGHPGLTWEQPLTDPPEEE
jgi:hypothetical protein